MVVKGGIRVFFIMWRTISLSLLSVVCMFGATGALADIASAGYVQEIVDSLRVQSDWMQTNPDVLDYIKNKPINHEIVDNKVTVLSADVTDEQYPSVRAVMHGELLDPQMVVRVVQQYLFRVVGILCIHMVVVAVVPFRQNLLWRKIWMAAQVAAVQPAPVPAVLCAFINLGNKKRPNGRFLLQEFHTRLCHFCNTFC